MKKFVFKHKKTPIKGAFSRKVLRYQRRLNNGYHPGSLGPSNVCQRIKQQYGTMMTRRERKRLAKALKRPVHLFYNYPTQFRSKGRKAQ